jgi:hypothetical protein
LRNLKIGFIGAQNLFSTMQHLVSLPGPQLGLRPQTLALAVAPLRWHGSRKNIAFALMKPIFQFHKGLGIGEEPLLMERWLRVI